MKKHTKNFATRQRGFTMLEVLISVVVLSIGLLGIAGLQATGQRNNHSAYLRSQATALAYDMIDRQTQLTARLPSGNGTVAGNGAGTSFTVTVMWDDDRNGSGSTTCGSGAMKCFSVSSTL